MQTCCFCWNLRQGSIASGIFTLVLAVLESLVTIYRIVIDLFVAEDVHGTKGLVSLEYGLLIVGGILWLLWIVSSILTIIGATQRKRWYYIPWFVATSLQCILMVLQCIFMTTITSTGMGYWVIALLAIQLLLLALCIYGMVCVGMDFRYMSRVQRGGQPIAMTPVIVAGGNPPGSYPPGMHVPPGQYPVAYYAASASVPSAPPQYSEKYHHPDNFNN